MSVNKIGSFLKRKKDSVEILDSIEYKRITIKTKHQGIFLRDICKGSLIGTKLQFKVKAGQFLLSKIDARLGAFGIVPDDLDEAIITGNFWAFEVDKNKVNIEWFNLFTSSGNFYEICDKASSGTTHRKYLDEKTFLNFEIELPDLEEQNDVLDKYKEYKKSFNALSNEIDRQKSYLQLLCQTIFQEAVQGKLTKQNAKDEPATELLKRIKAEKQKLIKEGKLKKEKELPPITVDEIPFESPKGWVWCRLGEIAKQITDGEHVTPPRTNTGYKLLSAKNVREGFLDYENCDYVSKETYEKCIKRCKPEIGDLLIVSVGGTIGRTSLVTETIPFVIVRSVAIIKPIKIDSEYLRIVMNSPLLQTIIRNKSRGGAQPCLYLSEIIKFVFPLPPLSEQRRIVAKVNQLKQQLNALETQAQQSRQYAEQLLKIILKGSFSVKDKIVEMKNRS